MSDGGLALIGAVARRLNGGGRPEEALAEIVEEVRHGLPARDVVLWVHEADGTGFARIGGSDGATVASIADAPLAEDTVRLPLLHDGVPLGLLDVSGAAPGSAAVMDVLTQLLPPFIAANELSEHLAREVATRTRESHAERRLVSLTVDCLPVGLYVVDRQYRIRLWNRNREAGTQGLRRAEVLDRVVFDVLTRQPRAALQAEFDRVFLRGEIVQHEHEVRRDGTARVFRTTRLPMRVDGDLVTHVVTIGEDITDARRAEARALQGQKLAAIGQLAAGVMHEINNPLATVTASVAAIRQRAEGIGGPEAPALWEYLSLVEQELARCERIIDGLLDFARPRAQARSPLELNAVVREALALAQHHPRARRSRVVTDLAEPLPLLLGNAEQLMQVVIGLAMNAFDAMEAPGTLTVRTRPDGDAVQLEVEDTGVGIAAEQLPHIFEPFFTTKPPGHGTGLGLAICYSIVQAHGGRLEAESTPGAGTRIRAILPVRGEGTPDTP